MNTQRTLSIIIPYIVLAAIFAVLASAASAGFAAAGESSALAAAKQLACGGTFYAYDWGAAALYAPLLQPVFMAASFLGGGNDGIFYLMRVLFVGVSFIVALVGYRVLSQHREPLFALLASAAFLLAACLLRDVFGVYDIALDAAFLALVLRCCIIEQLAADSGEATGYGRVLVPVLAGLAGFVALLFSFWAAIILLIVFAASLACAARAKDTARLAQQAWIAAGFVLGLAVYLIVVLGLAEPAQVFGALTAALGSSVCESLSYASPAQLVCAAVLAVAVLAVLALNSAHVANRMQEQASRISSIQNAFIGIAAFVLVIAVLCPQLAALYSDPHIEYGPAKELHCTQDELSAYADAYTIVSDTADDGSVFIDDLSSSNMWMYLLFSGLRCDDAPEWQMIVQSFASGSQDANAQIAGYGMVASSGACQLYKRAHEIGAISAG